ncbi:uncharacterized protein V6R79_009880 [Siganus canaliculatus]
MPGQFSCGVWLYIVTLLYGSLGFSYNLTENQLPNVTEEATDLDSPFLLLRASLPSYSQPVRPYNLIMNAEDNHFMPRPRHRRLSRLLRLLGSSFDPFWVSIEQPSEASWHGKKLNNTTVRQNLSGSAVLREAAAKHRQQLEKEAADLDLSSLPSHSARSVRDWLVGSATCGLSYQWVDLGPAFWPRWLRQTDCEKSDGEHSCSFPAGMKCVRAQTGHIKILAWYCLEVRDRGSGSRVIQLDKSDGSTKTESGEVMKKCSWRQVPYPVVAACTCSCH